MNYQGLTDKQRIKNFCRNAMKTLPGMRNRDRVYEMVKNYIDNADFESMKYNDAIDYALHIIRY